MQLKAPKFTRKRAAYFVVLCVGLVSVLTFSIAQGASDKLTVYVVNYPLKYFAARIAGDTYQRVRNLRYLHNSNFKMKKEGIFLRYTSLFFEGAFS